MRIFALSSNALGNWPARYLAFGAWLHFNRDWRAEDESTISNMISRGCGVFLVSGESSEVIEENIDWIVTDTTRNTVLTISSKFIDDQSAFDFLSTRRPGDGAYDKVICAFSESLEDEIRLLLEMARALDRNAE